MKTIVCYGDSNTWGCKPRESLHVPPQRFEPAARWPTVMQERLGDSYFVISEGLNSRTTTFDDPLEGFDRNGRAYAIAAIESHHPVDLVIVMLGVNDLKARFNASAITIAAGACGVAATIAASALGPDGRAPGVLVVVPPPTCVGSDEIYLGHFAGADARSAQFSQAFAAIGGLMNIDLVDAGDVIGCSAIDGIHLDADAHHALGHALADKVLALGLSS